MGYVRVSLGTLTLEALVDEAVQERPTVVAECRGGVCAGAEVVLRACILLVIYVDNVMSSSNNKMLGIPINVLSPALSQYVYLPRNHFE